VAALKPHLDGTALRQVNHGRSSTSFQTIQNSPASKHLLRGVPNGARSTSGAEEGHVVAKAEWTQGEANPRFVVTSLKRSEAGARQLYEDIHCARGDKIAASAFGATVLVASCRSTNTRRKSIGPVRNAG